MSLLYTIIVESSNHPIAHSGCLNRQTAHGEAAFWVSHGCQTPRRGKRPAESSRKNWEIFRPLDWPIRSTNRTMAREDDDLMRRSAGGDSAAFEMLVRRWEKQVGQVLARLMTRTSDRDDLCQEVFLRVLRAQHRYQPNGQFKSWLFRIVLNVARDAGRRIKRKPTVGLPHETELPGRLDNPTDFETKLAIKQTLSQLSPDVREAIVLRHFADLTFQQIATMTGNPVSTIKSRVQQGLKELRVHMLKIGISPQELLP